MSAPPLVPAFEGHFLPPPPVAAPPAAAAEEGEGGGHNKRRRLPSFKLREMEEELGMDALYAPQPPKRSKPGAYAGGGGGGRKHPKPKRKARGFHPYTSSFRGALVCDVMWLSLIDACVRLDRANARRGPLRAHPTTAMRGRRAIEPAPKGAPKGCRSTGGRGGRVLWASAALGRWGRQEPKGPVKMEAPRPSGEGCGGRLGGPGMH